MPRAKPNTRFGHDSWLRLRASHALVRVVEQHARRQQRSMSEYVRYAVTERLKADGVALPRDERVSA